MVMVGGVPCVKPTKIARNWQTKTRCFEPSSPTVCKRYCAFSRPQREVNTTQGLQGDLPQAFQHFFETLTGSHAMQGSLVVIIAVAAFLAGLCCERLRAQLARQAWHKRRWRRGEGADSFKARASQEHLLSLTQQSSFA